MPGKWPRRFQLNDLAGRRSIIRWDKSNQKNDSTDREGGDLPAVIIIAELSDCSGFCRYKEDVVTL